MKFTLVSIIFCLVFCSSSGAEVVHRATPGETSGKAIISESLSHVDTLFVIHFHPTIQCSCCINVGSFARKCLEQLYARPYNDSLIVFREYDIDEDSTTAKKYNIFWSALGFEKFSGEQNEFKEIESVWEFCEDDEGFLLNFEKELDQFILTSNETKSKDEDTKQDSAKAISKE